MTVHNLMEEYVSDRVDLLYNRLMEDKPGWLNFSNESCKMDVISYVLNKTKPRYIVSGRGVVFTTQEMDNPQLSADIDALAIEGIRLVASAQRHYNKNQTEQTDKKDLGYPYFNFPVFIGSVYDGTTFEPVPDASVTLRDENGLVVMQDISWQNPCKTFNATKGSYSFWPKSINAEEKDIHKKFHFTVEISAQGFAASNYGFDIPLISEDRKNITISSSLTLKIQDIFLFS